MTDPVWVLLVNHEHGNDCYVCKTEQDAKDMLVSYVEQWWEHEFIETAGEDKCPDVLDDDDIEKYFNKAQENYTLTLAYVIGG